MSISSELVSSFYPLNANMRNKSWYEYNSFSNYDLLKKKNEVNDFPQSEIFSMLKQILISSADYNILSPKESILLTNDLERTDHEIKHLSKKIQQMIEKSGITVAGLDKKEVLKILSNESKLQIVLLVMNLENGLRKKYNRYVSILTKLLQHEISVLRESLEYKASNNNSNIVPGGKNVLESQIGDNFFDYDMNDMIKNDMFIITKMNESLLNVSKPQNTYDSGTNKLKNLDNYSQTELQRTRSRSSTTSANLEYYDAFSLQAELLKTKKLLAESTKKLDDLSNQYKAEIADVNKKNESEVYLLQKNMHILLNYIVSNNRGSIDKIRKSRGFGKSTTQKSHSVKLESKGQHTYKSKHSTALSSDTFELINRIKLRPTYQAPNKRVSTTISRFPPFRHNSVASKRTNSQYKRNTPYKSKHSPTFKFRPPTYKSPYKSPHVTRQHYSTPTDHHHHHHHHHHKYDCCCCRNRSPNLPPGYNKKMTVSSNTTLIPSKPIEDSLSMYPTIFSSYIQDTNSSNKQGLENYLDTQKLIDLTLPLSSLKKSDISSYNKLQKAYFQPGDTIKLSQQTSVSYFQMPLEKYVSSNNIFLPEEPKDQITPSSSNNTDTNNTISMTQTTTNISTSTKIGPSPDFGTNTNANTITNPDLNLSTSINAKLSINTNTISSVNSKTLNTSTDFVHFNSVRSPMTITLYKGKYTDLDEFIETINTKSARPSSSVKNHEKSELVSSIIHTGDINQIDKTDSHNKQIAGESGNKSFLFNPNDDNADLMNKVKDIHSRDITTSDQRLSDLQGSQPGNIPTQEASDNVNYLQANEKPKVSTINQSEARKKEKPQGVPLVIQLSRRKLGSISILANNNNSIPDTKENNSNNEGQLEMGTHKNNGHYAISLQKNTKNFEKFYEKEKYRESLQQPYKEGQIQIISSSHHNPVVSPDGLDIASGKVEAPNTDSKSQNTLLYESGLKDRITAEKKPVNSINMSSSENNKCDNTWPIKSDANTRNGLVTKESVVRTPADGSYKQNDFVAATNLVEAYGADSKYHTPIESESGSIHGMGKCGPPEPKTEPQSLGSSNRRGVVESYIGSYADSSLASNYSSNFIKDGSLVIPIATASPSTNRAIDYSSFYQGDEEIDKHRSNFFDITKKLESSISNSKKNIEKLNSISGYGKTEENIVSNNLRNLFVGEHEFDGHISPTDVGKYQGALNYPQYDNILPKINGSSKKSSSSPESPKKKILGTKLLRKHLEGKGKPVNRPQSLAQSNNQTENSRSSNTNVKPTINARNRSNTDTWSVDIHQKLDNIFDKDEITKDSILIKLDRLSDIVNHELSNESTGILPIDKFFLKKSPISSSSAKNESLDWLESKSPKPVEPKKVSIIKNPASESAIHTHKEIKEVGETSLLNLSDDSGDNIESIGGSSSWFFVNGTLKKSKNHHLAPRSSTSGYIPNINIVADTIEDKAKSEHTHGKAKPSLSISQIEQLELVTGKDFSNLKSNEGDKRYTEKTKTESKASFLNFDYTNIPEIQKADSGKRSISTRISKDIIGLFKAPATPTQPQVTKKSSKPQIRSRLRKALSKMSSKSTTFSGAPK